ncbi:hypothetical protein MNEG_3298, partial [Monoraphidium neglectum]
MDGRQGAAAPGREPVPTLLVLSARAAASALAAPALPGAGASVAPAHAVAAAALPAPLRAHVLAAAARLQLLTEEALESLLVGPGAGRDTGSSALSCSSGDEPPSGGGGDPLGPARLMLAGHTLLDGRSLTRVLAGPAGPHVGACLRALSLSRVARLLDDTVETIAARCPALTDLDLSHCPRLTARAPAAVARGPAAARGLRRLSLARCWRVAGLGELAACSRLTCLELAGCGNLRNCEAALLLSSLAQLRRLDLRDCPR